MRFRTSLAALSASSLLLAACGGDGDEGAEEPPGEDSSSATGSSPSDEGPSESESTPGDDGAASATGEATALWVVASGSGSMYRVDLAEESVSTTVDLVHGLYDVEYADGAAWAVSATDGLYRVTADGASEELSELGDLGGVGVLDDQLWVGLGDPPGIAPLDAAAGSLGDVVAAEPASELLAADGVVYGYDDLSSALSRIDVATGEVVTGFAGERVGGLAADGEQLWAATAGPELVLLDAATLEEDSSVSVELPATPTAAVADPGSDVVWVGYQGGALASYDHATATLGEPVLVAGDDISAIVLVEDALWVAAEDGALLKLDPTTLDVLAEVDLPEAQDQLDIAVER